MSSSSVPNFSPIRVRIRVLWRILRSVRNEDEGKKNEGVKTKFCLFARISEIAGPILFKFGM